jgi:hypothetical protein
MPLPRKIVISVRVIDAFKSFWELVNKSPFWKYPNLSLYTNASGEQSMPLRHYNGVASGEVPGVNTMGTTVS